MKVFVDFEPLQWARTYFPLLLLLIFAKYVVVSTITAIRNYYNSDLYSLPYPPLPLWKRYTVGHDLLYHFIRADAFQTASMMNEWRKTHGSFFQTFFILGERSLFYSSENAIRRVFVSKQSSFTRALSTKLALVSLVGKNGLLLAEGDEHPRLRRAVAPAMHHNALVKVGDVFLKEGELLAERLRAMGDSAGDVMREVRASTFAVIFETCLGRNAATPEVVSKLEEAYCAVFPEPPLWMAIHSVLQKLFWFLDPSRFSYREDLKVFIRTTIRDICARQIEEYKSGSSDIGTPLVTLMIDDEKKTQISYDAMVETIMSFLVAGQATTSMSVCWTLYALARDTQWQDRLCEELKGWSEDDGIDALDQLPLLDRIVKESIRLYPPIFFISRKTVETVELDGFRIPKDTVLRVPILAVHRNEEIWGADASEFNPDRFLSEQVMAKSKMYWCPFVFGSRGCIGQRFALLEIKAFVVQVLVRQRVSVRPVVDAAPSCTGPFANPIGMKLYFESR